jgi:hypothetical protein
VIRKKQNRLNGSKRLNEVLLVYVLYHYFYAIFGSVLCHYSSCNGLVMVLPIREHFPEIPRENWGQRSVEHAYHISVPITHKGVIWWT